MHPYVLIPLGACVASATLALLMWLRAPGGGTNRPIALLFTSAAYWALCEVLWNVAPDAESALRLQRLSAPGWIALGPLCLHGFLYGERRRTARRWLVALYGISGLGLGLTWGTPWMLAAAEHQSWGWATVPGPLFLPYYAVTAACIGRALYVWARGLAATRDRDTRAQGPYVAASVLIPLTVCSLTDVLLPAAGAQVPRLGTASFAALGVVHAVVSYRYGLSPILPAGFSERILHMLPAGVAVVSLTGRVRTLNAEMLRLTGVAREEVVGREIGGLFSAPLFDPPREVRELECELAPLDGRPFLVAVSLLPLTSRSGDRVGALLVVRDLREMAALRNRLVTSGRLAAVGQLAAGIAHEINNPMAYVQTNLTVLRGHWERIEAELTKRNALPALGDLLAEGAELIDESLEGVARAVSIVRDVRAFSHAGRSAPEHADPNQLIEQVLRIARPQIPRGARLECHLEPVAPIRCAPQRVQQVLLNLVINAAQAIRPGGTIRIGTLDEGDRVRIAVEDDGVGIPPEVLERVFDPFFTTKEVGEGTGLGLAIAHEIVRQHRGEIAIECPPGGGTAVRVWLPAAPDESVSAA